MIPHEQERRRVIARTVRTMIRQHKTARDVERREQARTDFVQLVKVRTEDGREFSLFSRDVSATGIRLIGTQRLLGQKVNLRIPAPEGQSGGWMYTARILWTLAVGDDLFENGGTFLDVSAE